MEQYIKSFNQVNESMIQNGVILIKGKPIGRDKKQHLYATYVTGWAEVRPGAIMLFLGDSFYKIIEKDSRLTGIRVQWRDEDSLREAINIKSPGRLSVVRNNNKTPYHWKTLKHTSLRQALNDVEWDILSSGYLLESVSEASPIEKIVADDLLSAIFEEGKNIVVLDWNIPKYDYLENQIESSESRGTEEIEWSATFDCLHVGRPELDSKLEELELGRFTAYLTFYSNVSFHQWYDAGNWNTPPEEDIQIEVESTHLESIEFGEFLVDEYSDRFDKAIDLIEPADLSNIVKQKHRKFI
jgi:hypothetical protein